MHPKEKVEDRVFGLPGAMPAPALTSHESRTYDLFSVSVEGAEAVYASQGRLPLPPLVFVHGWGASHKVWRNTFSAFSPRYRCLAPDLPGFGLSEKPRRDYSVPALTAWLGHFLDALRLDRVTLAGHSAGGTIALLFALENPGRVERLAVSNLVVQGPTAFPRKLRFRTAPGVRAVLWALARLRGVRRSLVRDFTYARPLDGDIADDLLRAGYGAAMGLLDSLKVTDLASRSGTLAVPTLAIGTDRDAVVLPGHHELVAGARRETIRETGHIPMLERPEEFNRLLDAFLRE